MRFVRTLLLVRWAVLALLLATTFACVDGTDDAAVRVQGLRFDPANVEIPRGGTVTWHNDGHQAHTVTSVGPEREPDGVFDSGDIIGTGTYSFTFEEPGTYRYHCTYHWDEEMVGTVVVQP